MGMECARVSDTYERPTSERLRHSGQGGEEFVTPENTIGYRIHGQIDLLAAGREITGEQYASARQFYSDWYDSGLAYSGTIDPSKDVVDGGGSFGDPGWKMDAMTRFSRAVKSVGMVLNHVLTCVVIEEERLSDYGLRMPHAPKDPKRARIAALTALRLALDALDIHYVGHRKNGRYTASHAEGYRPKIGGTNGAG